MWPVLAAVVFVGVLFVAVFPTRTYLAQRTQERQKWAELHAIDARNAAYRKQIAQLKDPAHIELLARAQFGLVHPGDEAYSIEPGGPTALVPDVWPLQQLHDRLGD